MSPLDRSENASWSVLRSADRGDPGVSSHRAWTQRNDQLPASRWPAGSESSSEGYEGELKCVGG